jgi:hypothetical protein
MSMNTFAIAMDCPHATVPDVLVRVWLNDERGTLGHCDVRQALWGDYGSPYDLWIPSLDTWTLDTVRMILYELSAYVPADEHARAGVSARWKKPSGRPAKHPRPPQLEHVTFWVSACGWRASIDTYRNERLRETPDKQWVWGGFLSGDWSEPMIATLLDLTARSPWPLAAITEVLPGDPADLNLRYTPRLTLQRGIDEPIDTNGKGPGLLDRLRDFLDE